MPRQTDSGVVRAAACQKMDILFVIDDSESMREEQLNLADNAGRFADALENYRTAGGARLDFRIAITTTGADVVGVFKLGSNETELPQMGYNGRFVYGEGPECGENGCCGVENEWLTSNEANLSAKFSCAAEVGIDGPTIEMPLRTWKMALDRYPNFLRPDALHAAVILTDEDDCSTNADRINLSIAGSECEGNSSLVPVQTYIDALDELKGNRGRWAAAIIAGVDPGGCRSDQFGEAQEAKRLIDFAEGAGDNVVYSSICEGDLASALTRAIDTFEVACEEFPIIE